MQEVNAMKWNEMSTGRKILHVAMIICCGIGVMLCILHIAHVIDNGLNYSLLLQGVMSVYFAVVNWEKQRKLAIGQLILAAFLIITQLYILING
jgi:hypothetical protein